MLRPVDGPRIVDREGDQQEHRGKDAERNPEDRGHTRRGDEADRVDHVPLGELQQEEHEARREAEGEEGRDDAQQIHVERAPGRVIDGDEDRKQEDEGEGYEDRRQDHVLREILPPVADQAEDDGREDQDHDEIDDGVRHVLGARERLKVRFMKERRERDRHELGTDQENRHRRNRWDLAAHPGPTPASRVRMRPFPRSSR